MRLASLALVVALSQAPAERPRGPVVDFTAVHADGTPVRDLRVEDVEIRIGDRVRTIRSLQREGPRPGDPKMEARHRLKTDYEETAFRQLQAALKK